MKEQELALENLRHRILEEPGQADQALWMAVIAFQGFPFYTASGLPFWYTLKRSGSGELIVSRKEGSKTLTRSSILYAFHVVMHAVPAEDRADIPSYCGPKEIGQIFGISYIYSMFFRFGLIRVPKRVAGKLLNGSEPTAGK